MYGLIFDIVRDLVVTKHGFDTWAKLATDSGVPVNIELSQVLPYEKFVALGQNAAALLGVSLAEVLEVAGVWFIVWVKKSDYANILEMGGSSLSDVLQRVNMLHANMKTSFFPDMEPPQFFTTNVTKHSLRLHYAPGNKQRVGLGPLVVGIVKGLVEHWFVDMDVKKLKIEQEKFISKKDPFDVYHINWKKCLAYKVVREDVQFTAMTVGLDPAAVNLVFPFHAILDKHLRVVQLGHSLSKVCALTEGDNFFGKFRVTAPPKVKLTMKELARLRHEVWLLEYSATGAAHTVVFRFQLVVLERHVAFVGSPVFTDLRHATKCGINMSDFPLHDLSAQALFARTSTKAAEADMERVSRENSESLSEEWDADRSESDGSIEASGGRCPFSGAYAKESGLVRGGVAREVLQSEGVKFGTATSHSVPNLARMPSRPLPDGQPQTARAATSRTRSTRPSGAPSSSATDHTRLCALFEKDAREQFPISLALAAALTGDERSFEKYVAGVCAVYERCGAIGDFFARLLELERANVASEKDIFREDSTYVGVLMQYVRNTAVAAVRPAIKMILGDVQRARTQTQSTAPLSDEVRKNIASSFLDHLATSCERWPVPLRLFFRSVLFSLPECGRVPLVSVVFLRFICPAIIFPEKYTITTEDTSEVRRELVAISRWVQGIANDNDVVEEDERAAKQKIYAFLEELVDLDGFSLAVYMDSPQRYVCSTSSLRSVLSGSLDMLWDAATRTPNLSLALKNVVRSLMCSE
eukprot:TRINITY_DN858_c0_g1_i2.p1 TRINITY_DN858_c0_g1~~TRINITY_DN858_c0_g1_i2.p1  ORF type:complete len:755 (-),score=264.23 TRINITY_DN858_c0_g1_i2:194-2458(-)